MLDGWLSRAAVLSSSDKNVTGYMHCRLQSALAKLPHSLLRVLMDIPVAQHCWLYFGQHVFAACAQILVHVARGFMRKSDGALTGCPQLESYVHMLGDCLMQACLLGCHTVAVCPQTWV